MPKTGAQAVDPSVILGRCEIELVQLDQPRCLLHPQIVDPFMQLVESARRAGFRLQVASSYRNCARQLLIWNAKARGERPLLDTDGNPLDVTGLSQKEIVFAILRWSALPGASRHHWGTDMDVYDSSRMAADYTVQLTVAETQGDGPFAEFHRWLSEELIHHEHGFFCPYSEDLGGIAPEPWHLSYAPVAQEYSCLLTEALLRTHIESIDIELKDTLLENFGEIYQRFVKPYC